MEIRSFKAQWSNADAQIDGNPQLLVYTGDRTWLSLQDMINQGWLFRQIIHVDPMRKPQELMVVMMHPLKGLE